MQKKTGNLSIPRGRVLFGLFEPGTLSIVNWLDFGNCPDLSMKIDMSSVTSKDSLKGNLVDSDIYVVEREASLSLTTDNLGEVALKLWTNTTPAEDSKQSVNLVKADTFNVKNGGIFSLSSNPLSIIAVFELPSLLPLQVGVDYNLDKDFGTVVFEDHIFSYVQVKFVSLRGTSHHNAIGSSTATIEGELRFASNNPVGLNYRLIVPRTSITPTNSFTLIGDPNTINWNKLSFDVKVLHNPGSTGLFKLYIKKELAVEYENNLVVNQTGEVFVV